MKNGPYVISGSATSITGEQVVLNGEFNVYIRQDKRNLYADISRRVAASVEIDEEYLSAVGEALRNLYPPVVEPFRVDHCVSVSDLKKIAKAV